MKLSTVKFLFIVAFVMALFYGAGPCRAENSGKNHTVKISADKLGNVTQILSTNWNENVCLAIDAEVFSTMKFVDIYAEKIYLNHHPSYTLRVVSGSARNKKGGLPPKLKMVLFEAPDNVNTDAVGFEWGNYAIYGIDEPFDWTPSNFKDTEEKGPLYETAILCPIQWNYAVITLAN